MGPSTTMHALFIPAAVAEGRFLVKGYLWRLFYGLNTRYSLYNCTMICLSFEFTKDMVKD